jgi:hypothetical protein
VNYPLPQRTQRVFLFILCGLVLTSCGRKGPPLPPLVHVPAAVGELVAKRVGGDIVLQFKTPTTNTDGIAPADLDRLDVYAHTGPLPAPADYLKYGTLIGTIPVRAATGAGGSATGTPGGTREPDANGATNAEGASRAEGAGAPVEQGWVTSVRETLAPALLEPGALPYVKQVPTAPALAEVVETPGTVNLPPPVMRYYVVIGTTRRNKKGAFAGPVGVPISSELPAAPQSAKVTYSQDALTLTWMPAPGAPHRFNVYGGERSASGTTDATAVTAPGSKEGASGATGAAVRVGMDPVLPLNPAVLIEPTFTDKVEFGTTKCYVVRTVAMVGAIALESEPSVPACATPRDIFPPAAPKQLASVSDDKGVNLIWEANSEPDLAGYIVLRGEDAGDTMAPLTPEPVRETSYRDSTVQAGHSYVYAVVAVDNSTPPNRSEESNRQTEVIR